MVNTNAQPNLSFSLKTALKRKSVTFLLLGIFFTTFPHFLFAFHLFLASQASIFWLKVCVDLPRTNAVASTTTVTGCSWSGGKIWQYQLPAATRQKQTTLLFVPETWQTKGNCTWSTERQVLESYLQEVDANVFWRSVLQRTLYRHTRERVTVGLFWPAP